MRSAAHQNALSLGAPADDDPEQGDNFDECMEEEDHENDDELEIDMEDGVRVSLQNV